MMKKNPFGKDHYINPCGGPNSWCLTYICLTSAAKWTCCDRLVGEGPCVGTMQKAKGSLQVVSVTIILATLRTNGNRSL